MPREQTTVGRYIRDEVIPPGMSVTDAAARLGVGRPALSNLLNGKASLSSGMALRLERAFGANKDALLWRQRLQDEASRKDEEKSVAVRRFVPSLLTIKAGDIERWADSHEARDQLPVLLRRLVHETGDGLERVDFPGYDNSQRRGWDGWVEASTATAWIPEGRSGWELGASQQPRQKAESDYAKRLSLPLADRQRCTFVFVTPRNWPGKDEWVRQKEKAGDGWKAVRAYDASDLEQWLEESVSTLVWLGEKLPITLPGVETLDARWALWAEASELPMTEHIFESNIAHCVGPFRKWLEAPPSRPFVVAADSNEEALAFLACLIRHDDIPAAKRDLAVVFESAESLTRLVPSTTPFIPIAANQDAQERFPVFHKRFHCVATSPRNVAHAKPDFVLDLLSYEAFKHGLESMGISDRHEVGRLARESGRSPTVLRRRLSHIPAIRCPRWASDKNVTPRLVPMCLVGAWHAETSADKEVLAAVAKRDYKEIEETITRLQETEDSPVWSIGQHRGVVSKIDVLFQAAPLMTAQDVENFLTIAEYVLSEADPALELPESDRWLAAIYGKVPNHSGALRDSICETLVLLSIHGDELFKARLGIHVEADVSRLIERLLTPLGENLLSQEPKLPVFAEAAPGKLLAILESDLKKDIPAVLELLKPIHTGPFGHDIPGGLLWALECVAWNPQHLPKVCVLLAKLSNDRGDGFSMEGPLASLRGIFNSWRPQTAADLDDRMCVLKTLVRQYPDIGWRLCLDQLMLMLGPQLDTNNYRPRWRSDASGFGGLATRREHNAFRRFAVGTLLSWPKHDHDTLGDLVEHIEALSDRERSNVWDQIDAWADGQNDEKAVAKLRERIRRCTLTKKGRRKGRATSDRARLTYERIEPRSLMVRHAWLFADPWVEESNEEIENEELDIRARDERIHRLRQDAMMEIWAEHGLQGALEMVEGSSDGYTVGRYVASCPAGAVDVLHDCLPRTLNVDQFDQFLRAFIAERASSAGSDFVLDLSQQVGKGQSVRLLRCAPFDRKTWRVLDGLPQETQTEYWRTVNPRVGWLAGTASTEVVDGLLNAKRPLAALAAVRWRWEYVETGCLRRLLQAVASSPAPEGTTYFDVSYVGAALKELGSRPEVTIREMVELEFSFVEVLRGENEIPNLERQLAASPELFVQALSLCSERTDGGEDPQEWKIEDEAQRSAVARGAYSLLGRVARIPGTDDDGNVHWEPLKSWLRETRKLCEKVGRSQVGDFFVGEYLSKAPSDEDGIWPCTAVCAALEYLANEDVARGFTIGKRNSRGPYFRAGEGGDEERELAATFRRLADHRRVDYLFASSVLDHIAQRYEDDGKDEDMRATLNKRFNKWN